MPIYFNTKTNATSEMKESEFNKLPQAVQKRWRVAAESELKIHEKRMADKKILDDKEKARKKAKTKSDKDKKERYAKLAPKADVPKEGAKSGSEDKAESSESNN